MLKSVVVLVPPLTVHCLQSCAPNGQCHEDMALSGDALWASETNAETWESPPSSSTQGRYSVGDTIESTPEKDSQMTWIKHRARRCHNFARAHIRVLVPREFSRFDKNLRNGLKYGSDCSGGDAAALALKEMLASAVEE